MTTLEYPTFYCRYCGWSPDPDNPWQVQSSDKFGCDHCLNGCADPTHDHAMPDAVRERNQALHERNQARHGRS